MTRWGDNSQPRWFTLCFTTSAIGSAVQYIRPTSRLPASCTPAILNAHASLRVLNISTLVPILSQQQLRGQSPVHEARLVLALLSAPVEARCQKPTLAAGYLVTTRNPLPRYSDWFA